MHFSAYVVETIAKTTKEPFYTECGKFMTKGIFDYL